MCMLDNMQLIILIEKMLVQAYQQTLADLERYQQAVLN